QTLAVFEVPSKVSPMSALSKSGAHGAAKLCMVAHLGPEKLLPSDKISKELRLNPNFPAMVLLAAGKGTRFGQEPKCAQLVNGIPLARHSINAFRSLSPSPVICLVGYRAEQVAAALGE